MNRYSYVVGLRNNSNAVTNPDSNYRLASGQVRADSMDLAFDAACKRESVQVDVDPLWTMRTVRDYYRNGQRVAVYIAPIADDREAAE
jgi:hypothetical protein|tara:strand:+ start:436 stop:699 length:264 start_codon:yes stop_codon:yes gene_type:complete